LNVVNGNLAERPQRFTGVAIFLHWAIAILVLAAIGVAWAALRRGDMHSLAAEPLVTIHRSLGTTILVLAVIRLTWRWTHPAPPLPTTLRPWQRTVARASHGLLYLLLFLMPVTGLIDAAAFREPVHYFFLFTLPLIGSPSEHFGHAAFRVHAATSFLIYALVLLHSAAALYHHYVLKDGTLRRMLPALRP